MEGRGLGKQYKKRAKRQTPTSAGRSIAQSKQTIAKKVIGYVVNRGKDRTGEKGSCPRSPTRTKSIRRGGEEGNKGHRKVRSHLLEDVV